MFFPGNLWNRGKFRAPTGHQNHPGDELFYGERYLGGFSSASCSQGFGDYRHIEASGWRVGEFGARIPLWVRLALLVILQHGCSSLASELE
jgi:hypothetical protein